MAMVLVVAVYKQERKMNKVVASVQPLNLHHLWIVVDSSILLLVGPLCPWLCPSWLECLLSLLLHSQMVMSFLCYMINIDKSETERVCYKQDPRLILKCLVVVCFYLMMNHISISSFYVCTCVFLITSNEKRRR